MGTGVHDVLLRLPEGIVLEGTLTVPSPARGVVLFAHGSGSSRFSPRNLLVAAKLNQRSLATLLVDLLTADEEEADQITAHLRFDIELLAGRLMGAVHWLEGHPETDRLAVGLFGASTGAAAALLAAARVPHRVQSVVSRGGRPDLAGADELRQVVAPTLLIVGGADLPVVEMNTEALAELRCEKRLQLIAGASHLFPEPGALARVAELAGDWLVEHLGRGSRQSAAPPPAAPPS